MKWRTANQRRWDRESRESDKSEWHSWFAWHPVRINEQWVWWETVERRLCYGRAGRDLVRRGNDFEWQDYWYDSSYESSNTYRNEYRNKSS